MSDGPPSVEVVLRVERQAYADIIAPEPGCRLARPRCWNQKRGRGAEAEAECVVDPSARRVAEAQIGAVEYEETGFGVCPEPFCHGRHATTVVGGWSGSATIGSAARIGIAPTPR